MSPLDAMRNMLMKTVADMSMPGVAPEWFMDELDAYIDMRVQIIILNTDYGGAQLIKLGHVPKTNYDANKI